MTGNEDAPEEIPSPVWDPAKSVAEWLNQTGKECYTLKQQVKELERKLTEMNEKRHKQVAVMQELQQVLGLPFPDPKKIVESVRALCHGKN